MKLPNTTKRKVSSLGLVGVEVGKEEEVGNSTVKPEKSTLNPVSTSKISSKNSTLLTNGFITKPQKNYTFGIITLVLLPRKNSLFRFLRN